MMSRLTHRVEKLEGKIGTFSEADELFRQWAISVGMEDDGNPLPAGTAAKFWASVRNTPFRPACVRNKQNQLSIGEMQ